MASVGGARDKRLVAIIVAVMRALVLEQPRTSFGRSIAYFTSIFGNIIVML